jgi:hypothetical protein
LEVYTTSIAKAEPIAIVSIERGRRMRHRTGLHNKWRSGRSTYSIKKKARIADKYGALNGRKISDIIGGHVITYEVMASGQA